MTRLIEDTYKITDAFKPQNIMIVRIFENYPINLFSAPKKCQARPAIIFHTRPPRDLEDRTDP